MFTGIKEYCRNLSDFERDINHRLIAILLFPDYIKQIELWEYEIKKIIYFIINNSSLISIFKLRHIQITEKEFLNIFYYFPYENKEETTDNSCLVNTCRYIVWKYNNVYYSKYNLNEIPIQIFKNKLLQFYTQLFKNKIINKEHYDINKLFHKFKFKTNTKTNISLNFPKNKYMLINKLNKNNRLQFKNREDSKDIIYDYNNKINYHIIYLLLFNSNIEVINSVKQDFMKWIQNFNYKIKIKNKDSFLSKQDYMNILFNFPYHPNNQKEFTNIIKTYSDIFLKIKFIYFSEYRTKKIPIKKWKNKLTLFYENLCNILTSGNFDCNLIDNELDKFIIR